MKTLPQLSIFVENKPGAIEAPLKALAEAGVNIYTLCIADTKFFGVMRLLVHDTARAREVLEKAGYAVNLRDVVAVKVPDRPGGLVEVLSVFSAAGVNIEYMYAFTGHSAGDAVMVFRFDDPEKAVAAVAASGHSMIAPAELFGSAE